MPYPFGKPMFDFFAAEGNPVRLMDSLERFIEFWFGYREVDFGVSETKLQAFQLPEPLRRLYRFAGQWPAENCWGHLFTWRDYFLPFELLQIEQGKLVFLWEEEGAWVAGTSVAGDDPPVWVHKDEGEWYKVCDSLAQFLVTLVLKESVEGSKYRGFGEPVLESLRQRGCNVVPVWLDGPYPLLVGKVWRRSFHLVDHEILVCDDSLWGTQTERPFERFPELFKKDEMPIRKLPFWESMPVRGGLRSLLEQMAWRHQRYAAEHEELMRMHRRWERFFREAVEKSRKEEA